MAFWAEKIIICNFVFKAPIFFRRKLAKVSKNCDHKIEPREQMRALMRTWVFETLANIFGNNMSKSPEKVILNIGYQENRQYFRRKYVKIARNSYPKHWFSKKSPIFLAKMRHNRRET
jgi:hypothetical protein